MKRFLCIALLCAVSTSSWAMDYTLLTSEPSRNAKPEFSTEAFFKEIVGEIFKRAELELSIKQEPWIKAQKDVMRADPKRKLLIAPLTRTEGREAKYDWILPIASYKLQFVTNDPDFKIADLNALKSTAVCAFRESPAEYKLKELQFPDISSRVQVSKCYEALKKGQIKAVLAHGEIAARKLFQQVGGKPDTLVFGRPFSENTVYLASTTNAVSDEDKQKMNNALDAMHIDGTYEEIFARHK